MSAGRGLLYITAAKMWFMIGAYAILFALPHLLDQALVGQWNLILSWVSPLNNVMVTATIQSVSRFSSRGIGMQRAALRLQLGLGGGLALLFLVGAPLIAGFEHKPALIPGLRLVSVVVLAYSFYAVFVGAANGAREFHKQAALDATYTTLRAGLVIGGALALRSVMGAVVGFSTAAATILVISVVVVGLLPVARDGTRQGSVAELVRFMAPIALFLLIINMIMFVDLWLVTRMIDEAARTVGVAGRVMDLAAAAKYASEQAAIYANGVQAFARIPYQLILSVTFVIFPLVSRSTFDEDRQATRIYIARAMRYSLLVVAAMAAAMAARPDALLSLFGAKYTPGATALPVLAFGYVAFSLLTICATIINGAGRTLPTLVIGAITLGADAAGNVLAIGWATANGHDPLLAAAIATASAMALGLAIAAIYLRASFGASLPLLSLGRVAVASAAAIALGRILPLHGRLALAACLVGGAAFIAVLFATRELTFAELRSLRRRR